MKYVRSKWAAMGSEHATLINNDHTVNNLKLGDLKISAGGSTYTTMTTCSKCGAMVADHTLHKTWHQRNQP